MENLAVPQTPAPIKKNKNILVVTLITISGLILVVVSYLIYQNVGKNPLQNASQEPKLCDGVKIVFFPGGNETDSFASVVYNGAKAAQDALGANVSYVWSDWDSSKMVSQFIDAISTTPDAIAIMGHPGEAALTSLVDEAERKNIIVTMQNVDIPQIREKYISNGFGYVGASLYNAGLLVSNGVVRKYQPADGTEVVVFGVNPQTDPGRYERTKGILDGLNNAKLLIHEITITPEVNKDVKSPASQKLLSDALNKYPGTKIIIIDHGPLTAVMPTLLKNSGLTPGSITVAGFDLSVDTVAGIKNGYIGLIQDQQPYLQGFMPILQSCLTKKYGFAGMYIDTGVGLIDGSNVDFVANLATQKIR